jgi:hypothetical protein
MPKLERFVQEPLPLYPSSEVFNGNTGIITATLEDMPWVDPERRITLGRLATQYGNLLGPTDGLRANEDSILQVAIEDFKNASIDSIKSGLFIYPNDLRFRSRTTEQLVKVDNWYGRFSDIPGVVFHAHEYPKIAKNPEALVKHKMAQTRSANADNTDKIQVEGKVGRTPGHVLTSMIQSMNNVDSDLISVRNDILVPLTSETNSTWQAHYKAANLDKKFKLFIEEAHNTLETASINLNIGTIAVKAAHRALTSRLTRYPGTRAEQNQAIRSNIFLLREYIKAKRHKIRFARERCEEALIPYEPFMQAAENGSA